ncbi:hypothetical protein CEXT_492851 [Caerostris extrusa]|uniref:Uncharacterized protein n=1 Tax=Caerostris extrusa TaxID=172846 RepID=A0AAV4UU31_CAEEX|nr:hypothetical protein CEXT_492851 [Caerostris extrusa]
MRQNYLHRDTTTGDSTNDYVLFCQLLVKECLVGERGCNMGKFQEQKALSCDDKCYFGNYFSFTESFFGATDRSKGIKCAKRGIFQALPSEDPVKMRQNYLHRDTTTGDSTNDYVCSANYWYQVRYQKTEFFKRYPLKILSKMRQTETPPVQIRHMIMSVLPTSGERLSRRREAVIWESFQEQKKLSLATISAILATISLS